jgi:hypothetical protein
MIRLSELATSPRSLLLLALLVSTGCSDFLGIDQFSDRGDAASEGAEDADPAGEGGGEGGGEPIEELDGGLLWWSAFGEAGMDDATAVAPLSDAVQLAGLIEGPVDFGGGAVGESSRQAFVARFDLEGAHVWSVATSGSGVVDHVQVATGSDEGAVIAGTYRGALTLESEALPAAPGDAPAVFVAWLTADGDVTRATSFPVTGEVAVRSVALSPSKDVAVVGTLSGTLEVGAQNTLAGSPNDTDALLLILGDDASPKLATNLRTPDDTRDQRLSVARYDPSGALWVGGSFRGSLAFDDTSLASVGASDGILAHVDLGSGLMKASLVDRLLLGGGQSEVDVTAVEIAEDIVIGGTYSEALVLGDHELDSRGSSDAFVARLEMDLAPTWASTLGSSGPETLSALGVDELGHVTLTGSYSADLIAGETMLAASNGGHDSMVAKLDADGLLTWARTFGRQGNDQGHGLAVDADGRALVAGAFTDGISLDDEMLKSSGMQDIFVLRLDH